MWPEINYTNNYVLDFAKANAIALPIPLLEPVTTATFPVCLVLLCIYLSQSFRTHMLQIYPIAIRLS
jgi:hypothetical protein